MNLDKDAAQSSISIQLQTVAHNLGMLSWTLNEYRSKQNPSDGDTLRALALASYYSQQNSAAIRLLNAAIAISPDAFLLSKLAQTYLRQGQYDAALEASTSAAEIDPTDAIAHIARAASFLALGKSKEAVAAASEASALSGDPRADAIRDLANQTLNSISVTGSTNQLTGFVANLAGDFSSDSERLDFSVKAVAQAELMM